MNPDDEMMTPGEAAEFLGISPHMLRSWAKRGRIQASWTIGGHLRIRRSVVEAMIKVDGKEMP